MLALGFVGLMNNGTIWGHGAFLGPDYSAEALQQIGIDVAADLSQQHYRQLAGA